MNIEIGKEYVTGHVIGVGLAPVICNSQYNPEHPCRITVLSIGRKYIKALMSGSDKPQPVLATVLWDIEDARKSYRHALETRDAKWAAEGHEGLGAAKIDELVNSL